MPKLAAKARKTVSKAEPVSGGFEPHKPGKYFATLNDVEAKMSTAGNAMWVAEFTDLQSMDGESAAGRQWLNMMLPNNSMPEIYKPKKEGKDPEEAWEQYQNMCNGRLKSFFEAFGYEVDSDTDEMIGDRCVIQLSIQTIQGGPKKGEKTNRVEGIFSVDSAEGADAEKDDDDDF